MAVLFFLTEHIKLVNIFNEAQRVDRFTFCYTLHFGKYKLYMLLTYNWTVCRFVGQPNCFIYDLYFTDQ